MTTLPVFLRELLLTAEPGYLCGQGPLSQIPGDNEYSKERE